MSSKGPTPWLRVLRRSAIVSVAALAGSCFVRLDALSLLAVLFCAGFLAGAWGQRQGWFSGIVVGLPFSFHQFTRMASTELGDGVFSQPDYWRLAAPAALVAAGMAILGAMTGAWLQDMKLQKA